MIHICGVAPARCPSRPPNLFWASILWAAGRIVTGVVAGVVTSNIGPEAGVWVIAETNDLATLYSKTVVTDDQGRYLIPDLPQANYEVWVRGYGLVDSPRTNASPGQELDLIAQIAPDAASAAEYYPAGYWYSLLEIPEAHEFPGTGPDGNGIATGVQTQDDYIRRVTNGGCVVCRQGCRPWWWCSTSRRPSRASWRSDSTNSAPTILEFAMNGESLLLSGASLFEPPLPRRHQGDETMQLSRESDGAVVRRLRRSADHLE